MKVWELVDMLGRLPRDYDVVTECDGFYDVQEVKRLDLKDWQAVVIIPEIMECEK